jgi:2-dehydropantoate 2-reductase
VLAEPSRLARYREEGFVLNGRRVDFPLAGIDSPEERDLVIVAVKNHQLARAIEDMRGQVGPRTLVLSLLNGITSEDALGAAFGPEKVPLAMILGIDAMRDGNSTVFSSAGKIHFGDARNVPGASRHSSTPPACPTSCRRT